MKRPQSAKANKKLPRRTLFTHSITFLAGVYVTLIFTTIGKSKSVLEKLDDPLNITATGGRQMPANQFPVSPQSQRKINDQIIDHTKTKSHPITFDDIHSHDLTPQCMNDVTPILFDQWRASRQNICSHDKMIVQKYTMKRWEKQPSFHVYKHIFLSTFWSNEGKEWMEPFTCQDLKNNIGKANEPDTTIEAMNRTVIRVMPFDPENSYERFHAYLNVAMAMAMFNITDPQIVYVTSEKNIRKWNGIQESEIQMWESFSSTNPIIVTKPEVKPKYSILVPYMIDLFHSGTSILVSKTGAGLRGRGVDHHCKSTILCGILRWMKSNLLGDDDIGGSDSHNNDAKDGLQTIQIVWSSRQPYCCRPKGKIYKVKRSIANEDELVRQVGEALGSGYNITTVNFGSLTLLQSVKIASQSNIMVGAHGAGLIWSSFLKLEQHSGLLEMFGGDRSSGNRHYHNLASLADIHYRSLSLRSKNSVLTWDSVAVSNIAEKIRSIDLNKEPGTNEN